MRTARLAAILAIAMVLLVSVSAMAAQGRWKSFASDSTGKLTDPGSQSAYVTTSFFGAETKVTGLQWTLLSGDPKAADYSSTTTDGSAAVWNINDASGTTYQKTAITPVTFDSSRGLIMAKIRVISAGSVNGTFGFSTDTGYGIQLGLRGSAVRIRTGEGGANYVDPANFDQFRYRVYAISWIGNVARVFYSNGTDWSGNAADWVELGSGYTMASGTGTMNGGSSVKGIVLYDCGSSNSWNGNIEWIAHTTYDNELGEMVPWDFNPAVVPEPGSLLALGGGLMGMLGFIVRKRK